MSRVITFSRVFPSYHPRKGEQTRFLSKLINSFGQNINYYGFMDLNLGKEKEAEQVWASMWDGSEEISKLDKHHTVRSGMRFKIGEKFSPRVWSDKPYKSKQIVIGDDVEIKKVWSFEVKIEKKLAKLLVEGIEIQNDAPQLLQVIARNDGLSFVDFLQWFQYPTPFKGQIICWNENIKY